jgi:hypothetical protein
MPVSGREQNRSEKKHMLANSCSNKYYINPLQTLQVRRFIEYSLWKRYDVILMQVSSHRNITLLKMGKNKWDMADCIDDG